MGLETDPQYPSDLNAAWPLEGDPISQGNDHFWNIKNVMKNAVQDRGVALSGVGPFDLDLDLYQDFTITVTAIANFNFINAPTKGTKSFIVRVIDGDTFPPVLDTDVDEWKGGLVPTIDAPIYELGFRQFEGETTFTGYDIGAVAAP